MPAIGQTIDPFHWNPYKGKVKVLTWSRLNKTGSVLSVDFFAASQNCFWEAYLFIGHIRKRQSLNFFGMFVRSPDSGHTTHRSSTRLEEDMGYFISKGFINIGSVVTTGKQAHTKELSSRYARKAKIFIQINSRSFLNSFLLMTVLTLKTIDQNSRGTKIKCNSLVRTYYVFIYRDCLRLRGLGAFKWKLLTP